MKGKMKERINKVETYESPKCGVMELLSEGPLLRPSLTDPGDGDDGHIPGWNHEDPYSLDGNEDYYD